MPELSGMPQSADPGMMQKLASMFGGAGQAKKTVVPGELPDSAAASAGPEAAGIDDDITKVAPDITGGDSGGLMAALQNLMQFLKAKPGSASNDQKYQTALEDAGLPPSETGVGM